MGTGFSEAFGQVSTHGASVYANLLRFVGIAVVLIACAIASIQYMDVEAKAADDFIPITATRLLKLIFGLTVIILILIP